MNLVCFFEVKIMKISDWFLLFLEFKVGEKTLGRELFDNILQTTGIREKWYEIKNN